MLCRTSLACSVWARISSLFQSAAFSASLLSGGQCGSQVLHPRPGAACNSTDPWMQQSHSYPAFCGAGDGGQKLCQRHEQPVQRVSTCRAHGTGQSGCSRLPRLREAWQGASGAGSVSGHIPGGHSQRGWQARRLQEGSLHDRYEGQGACMHAARVLHSAPACGTRGASGLAQPSACSWAPTRVSGRLPAMPAAP